MSKKIIFLIVLSLILFIIVGILFYLNSTKEQEFRISEINKYEMLQKGEMPTSTSDATYNTPIENTSDIEKTLMELEKDLNIDDLELTE